MDALAEKLDSRLRTWRPKTRAEVRDKRRLLPGYLCASSITQIATRPTVSSAINFKGGFWWRSNPGNPSHLNTRRR